MKLVGQKASQGTGIGKVHLLIDLCYTLPDYKVSDLTHELQTFKDAHKVALDQLNAIYSKAKNNLLEEEAQIFEAHIMMMKDEEFVESIEDKITHNHLSAPQAVKETKDYFVDIFNGMDNPYFKERALDIKDISNRLLRILLGIEETDLAALPKDTILVAKDLTPSDTMSLVPQNIAGFIIEKGGYTSHTAIIARTLQIPAVIGVGDATKLLMDQSTAIVDGNEGLIIQSPNEDQLAYYKEKQKNDEIFLKSLESYKGKKTCSLDGYNIELLANIGSVDDIPQVISNDANGVGLLRTEFIYMDRTSAPSEEEQFNQYRQIVEALSGKILTIRTLDVGGDKEIPYLSIPKEDNPFLGFRAIRYCLQHPAFFKEQLRAILRASHYGPIKIMSPMVVSLEELRHARGLLEEAKIELSQAKIPFDPHIKWGMMIETPAAVIMARFFAKEVDFFSIGTNDLTQYINVADRMNEDVSHLYSPYYPAIIHAIHHVATVSKEVGIDISICGEIACDELLTPLWLRLGIKSLSMVPSQVLKTRYSISTKSVGHLNIDEVLTQMTSDDIQQLLRR